LLALKTPKEGRKKEGSRIAQQGENRHKRELAVVVIVNLTDRMKREQKESKTQPRNQYPPSP
jgi:hypothetical protein